MVEEAGPEMGWRSFIFPKVAQLEFGSNLCGLDMKMFQNGPCFILCPLGQPAWSDVGFGQWKSEGAILLYFSDLKGRENSDQYPVAP